MKLHYFVFIIIASLSALIQIIESKSLFNRNAYCQDGSFEISTLAAQEDDDSFVLVYNFKLKQNILLPTGVSENDYAKNCIDHIALKISESNQIKDTIYNYAIKSGSEKFSNLKLSSTYEINACYRQKFPNTNEICMPPIKDLVLTTKTPITTTTQSTTKPVTYQTTPQRYTTTKSASNHVHASFKISFLIIFFSSFLNMNNTSIF